MDLVQYLLSKKKFLLLHTFELLSMKLMCKNVHTKAYKKLGVYKNKSNNNLKY